MYFLSDRHFRSAVGSPWGPRQPDPYFEKSTQVYALALRKGEVPTFLPAHELDKDSDKKKEDKEDNEEDKKEKEVQVEIDFEGIQNRLFLAPVGNGHFRNLSVSKKHLFWQEDGMSTHPDRLLKAWEIKRDAETVTLVEKVSGYRLSSDRKKLLVKKGDNLYVIDAKGAKPKKLAEAKVDLSKWRLRIDPTEEWRQMLVDAWRMHRDWFYDKNMHGVDWKGELERHLPLVDRVKDRDELNEVIGHFVGELSALHTSINAGDVRRGDDRINPAKLGARLRRADSRGGYEVEHIYRSDPDYRERLSPLARPEVGVSEGDVIVSVNGISTLSVPDIAVQLKEEAGGQVLLGVKTEDARRDVIVYPISGRRESSLRYEDWEYSRRLAVEKASDGAIGYVHLRAMGRNDIAQWVREYPPVFDRKGLIVDVRHNNGGNIDSWILGKLLRKAWFYWQRRVGKPYWNMQQAFRGHLVVLVDERTASDGEAFAEGFRRLGLGPVIGKRTWGGEIWLSGSTWLVDRGRARSPESGVYGPEREWLIEGHGVEPDQVVDNLPHATFNGKDAQLDAAIAYLKKMIEEDPREVPPPPPYPNKAFDYEKE